MYVGLGGYETTISAQKRFDDLRIRDNRIRNWCKGLDTQSQSLHVTLAHARRPLELGADFFSILLAVH
jgi:hypothetical protein